MGKYASTRNHGWGSKVAYALSQAMEQYYGGGHYSTAATHGSRLTGFIDFLRESGVRDLARNDEQRLLESYAESVAKRVKEHEISTRYAHNLISTANVAISALRGDDRVRVSPSEYCGSRTNVRTVAPVSLDTGRLDRAMQGMRDAGQERAAAVAGLARHLGLREKEATLADLTRLARESERYGQCNIQDGTKGGRSAPRWITVTPAAREALASALECRPSGSRNLLNENETLRSFINGELKAGRAPMHEAGIKGYHDCRAAYACERYYSITGHEAPAVCGNPPVDRQVDQIAREQIAPELGHGRTDVCIAYVGGRT